MRDGALRVFHELQATSHEPASKTPTPALPEGEGASSDTNCELRAFYRRQTIIHKLQTTSYELQATYCSFRFPGRGRRCQPRSGAHAGRGAWIRLLSTWNVGEGFKPSPTGKEPEAGQDTSTGCNQQSTSYKLQATSHGPTQNESCVAGRFVAVTTHHALSTTYQRGRTHGPAPTSR